MFNYWGIALNMVQYYKKKGYLCKKYHKKDNINKNKKQIRTR